MKAEFYQVDEEQTAAKQLKLRGMEAEAGKQLVKAIKAAMNDGSHL